MGNVLWRKSRLLLNSKENKSSRLGSIVGVGCAGVRGHSCGSLACAESVFGKELYWERFLELLNPAGRWLVYV